MSYVRDRLNFDRWAPSYDESWLQPILFSPAHAAALDAGAAAYLGDRPPRDVLDVGSGTGRLLERISQRWPEARLIGVDASPVMVEQARRKHPGDAGTIRFEVGDAARLPLADASVDLAFSTISFHHWGDQATGVREVARVLRPGGVFVLTDIWPRFLPLPGRFRGPAARSRFFEGAGLTVLEQRWPKRLGATVLVSSGRKATLHS